MGRVRRSAESVDNHGQITKRSPKTIWHPLSLQRLRPTQFVDVVNRIVDGRNELCEGTLKGASGVREEDRVFEQMQELATAAGSSY
jgi:hypothetical protein